MTHKVDVAIIGAGSGGLSAFPQIEPHTQNVAMINAGPYGTTCARVGCMPSKVLIQTASDYHRRTKLDQRGIRHGDQLEVDFAAVMEHVRSLRDRFVKGVMGGTTRRIGERHIQGEARFLDAHRLQVGDQVIEAAQIIIACGSRPMVPDAWRSFSAPVLTSDEIFEVESLPGRIAVMGTGVIGMELGQALARLGFEVTAFGRSGRMAGLTDPALNKCARDVFATELDLVFSYQLDVSEPEPGRIRVAWEDGEREFDAILAAQGRISNVDRLNLAAAGIACDDQGIPLYNPLSMQLESHEHIYIAGDATGRLPILHEASDEGRIAGYNCVHPGTTEFRRREPIAVTFSEPNAAVVGLSHAQLEADGIDFATGSVDFSGQGRALVMGKNAGLLHVYGDRQTGALLGAEILAPSGEHLAHLLSWCMQADLDVFEVLRMPYYHPVVEEGLRTAIRDLAKAIDEDRARQELDVLSDT